MQSLYDMQTLLALITATTVRVVPTANSAAQVVVNTPYGALRGREYHAADKPVHAFLGVPFAEPPVGALRFKPPQNLTKWQDEKTAYIKARSCPQGSDTTFGEFRGSNMWNAKNAQSEDCLQLNIWTPAGARNSPTGLPVLVWLFGGGFWYGTASLDLYDGATLAAAEDVVVVNINYRVGAFGFLFLNHSAVPGNMGLLDQQMALKWLKQCIRSFGGDPNKITLFGESAGAASITAHMLAPGSRDLFRDGILQSGTLDNKWAMDTPNRAFEKSWEVVKLAGCAPAKDPAPTDSRTMDSIGRCLRSRSEFPLVIVSRDANFFSNKDAFATLREGPVKNDTNLIIGINKDEGTFWNIYYVDGYLNHWNSTWPPNVTGEKFTKYIEASFNTHPVVVRRAASHTYWNMTRPGSTYFEATNQATGDYFFSCDALSWADEMVKRNYGRVWVYLFTQPSSQNPWPKWTGVMHGYEIEFVFGVPVSDRPRYNGHETRFSDLVMELWKNFAEKREPGDHSKHWPEYKGQADSRWLNLHATEMNDIQRQKTYECEMWRNAKDIEYELQVKPEIYKIEFAGAATSTTTFNHPTLALFICLAICILGLK